ncbi:MAG: hypothetical protein J5732_00800 [Bacteroidaceae bacterium]|nr:hypothetical protein [Bacteroidaceae bacterium]
MSTVVIEIKRDKVLESVKEEVSRVAASAYNGEGFSLYDSIIIYSRDGGALQRMYKDALSKLVERSRDILLEQLPESPTEEFYAVLMVSTEPDAEQKYYYFKANPPIASQIYADANGIPFSGTKGVAYNSEQEEYEISFHRDDMLIATGTFSADSEPLRFLYHPEQLIYNLPDFNMSLLKLANADVVRFLTQYITALWLIEKHYQRAEEFVSHANMVLEETIHHLKIRKPVSQRISL